MNELVIRIIYVHVLLYVLNIHVYLRTLLPNPSDLIG